MSSPTTSTAMRSISARIESRSITDAGIIFYSHPGEKPNINQLQDALASLRMFSWGGPNRKDIRGGDISAIHCIQYLLMPYTKTFTPKEIEDLWKELQQATTQLGAKDLPHVAQIRPFLTPAETYVGEGVKLPAKQSA